MTCATRGSRARASCSTLPNSSTFAVLPIVAIGSSSGYRDRVGAIFLVAIFVRALRAAEEMERTVRAASSIDALDRSSE